MNPRNILGCVLATISVAAGAQNRLTPVEMEHGVLESYQDQVRLVLREAFLPDVKASVVVEPSFRPETAIGLRARANGFELFALQPAQHIWRFQLLDMMKKGQDQTLGPSEKHQQQAEIAKLEASLPKRVEQIRVDRCQASVDRNTANAVLSAWSQMLKGVHAGDSAPFGMDGETYYFSMPSEKAG